MREWHLTASDPMSPRIAADARSGRTLYRDDQTWQLRLGQPDEPALTLETRYGGRVGLARLVPLWFVGRRQIYEAQGYHAPPVLTAFAPDYLRVKADLTLALHLTYEFWAMESQAVGGRFTVTNSSDHPQELTFSLSAQAVRENETLQMYFLTLEGGQAALQLGRLPNLQPVLLLENADPAETTKSRLSRAAIVAPGQSMTFRWVLGSHTNRDDSLILAHKWLSAADWSPYFDYIETLTALRPEVETGDPAFDSALAWSQHLVMRSFLAATGSLPYPSFVSSRKPSQGYALSGVHSGGFVYPWGGQTVADALSIAATVALAAPDLAKGIVRNFLAAQRDDGWIDARPGLDGQRANVLATPLLATLAYTVYQYTGDKQFLADCLSGLEAFFHRWFKPDVDADRDGVPEWSHPGQGAFNEGPTLAQGKRWAQGVDLTTIEAPDLTGYLAREARVLIQIAQVLGRDDVAAEYEGHLERLTTALHEMWHPERGTFNYRDRDSHACPTGEIILAGKGDDAFRENTQLANASRLILRVIGGLSRKPNLDCTIEGLNAAGKSANETIPASDFDWYRGMGSATSKTVWREIKYLKFGGLSRVFKVEVQTVDLARHDQALLMPLWSSALTDDQTDAVVAMLTDPDQYWREYGVSGSPASDPDFDPSHQNGCGGMWPNWNARLGAALFEADYVAESRALFENVLAAQIRSLQTEGTFRSLYNADTGDGQGDTGTIEGAVSWRWFTLLFGAFVLSPGAVAIRGEFAFDGTMRWMQHGVTIERSADQTIITFPTGTTQRLKPDAEPQIVNDPKFKPRQQKPTAAPPPDPNIEPPASDSGEPDAADLLPDGV